MHQVQITVEHGKQEVLVTRLLDAPPALVFKAMTDPIAILQWWGPGELSTEVETLEVYQGGKWRIVQTDAAGNSYGFHGVYHEVSPSQRIVRTFEYEGEPGHVILETTILENLSGKTAVTVQSVFQSIADRDGMMQAGMERGIRESYERLDTLLPKMR